MSDDLSDLGLRNEVSAQRQADETAGVLLRNARESAGLHVAALAVLMKVPVKKLEALEADRLDLLPDAVFVRALASSVCRTLKIDPVPILNKLPETLVPRLDTEDRGINTPFHAPGDIQKNIALMFFLRPQGIAVIFLLIAALLVWKLPLAGILEPSKKANDALAIVSEKSTITYSVTAEKAPESMPAASNSAATMTPAAPTSSANAAIPAISPLASVSAPLAVSNAVVPSTPTSAPTGVEKAIDKPLDKSLPTTGIVVFQTRADSWIEVTDAKKVIQLSRVIEPGKTIGVSGALPLSIVIGRADVTEVSVRGKIFDLSSVAKENVARFEVK